ncbi:MAG TPA: ice-binding family protein [Prolixibacteraceae bacterium]|nr:ice-binding family protein [Prolixibacteraceae bacterium]
MNLKKVLPVLAILAIGLMFGCEKPMDNNVSGAYSVDNSAVLSSSSALVEKSAKIESDTKAINAVNLGLAGDFVILSKTGITDVYKSDVTGDIGTSPITGAAIDLECSEVTGTIYTVDAAGPLPCRVTNASRLTTAVSDMQTAYTDAAGRSKVDFLNLGAGNIGGKTLTPGLYKFTSEVVIPTDITISGSSTDVWIFQIAGTLKMSSAVRITLAGGAQAKNIFWQVSDAVTLGTTSHFEGNILCQTGINLKTGASINGRMLAQTAVTLQMNTVVVP